MTTPSERTRALRWGWELLETLQRDSLVSPTLAQRANELSQVYPRPSTLVALIGPNPPSLPSEFGATIDAARLLFQEVQFGHHGAPQTQRDATFTLRHVLLAGSADWAAVGSQWGGLNMWLASEDG